MGQKVAKVIEAPCNQHRIVTAKEIVHTTESLDKCGYLWNDPKPHIEFIHCYNYEATITTLLYFMPSLNQDGCIKNPI